MATFSYSIGEVKRSVTSPKGKGNYSYGAQHIFLPTNEIPPFSTINSVTLTHTKTNTTGSFRKSVYRSSTADSTTITTTPLTFDVTTIGGSQTVRAGKMLYHFSIYTSAQGSGTIIKTSNTSTATRNDVTLTYDYTPPNTLINFYIYNPTTNTTEDFPFSQVDSITKVTTSSSGSYNPNNYSSGSYIPVPFNGNLTSTTSATITIDPAYDYITGYHPDYWTDGINQYTIDSNGNTNISWDSSDTTKNFTLVFAKNTYTVQFWDNTKNPAVLVDSMVCEGGITYSTPAFPQYEARPGYAVNTTGWIKSLTYNNTYNKICKASTSSDTLYYYATSEGSSSYTVTQYSSFTDLSTVNGDIINLYFIYAPIRYSITYRYRLSTSSTYASSTVYRVFGESATSLSTLTSKMSLNTGYKWLNTTPNYWYTSEKTTSTGYLSEGEQVASIASNYVGDINLYAYQVPIEYSVIRHVYDINGTEIDFNGAETLNCQYGTTYNRNTNLTFITPTTITNNAIVKESYENKFNNAEYGFTLTTNNGVNTYTRESFTTAGVAMMKLIVTAKAPCILTLTLGGRCYSTYNRWFISKLDGDPLSIDYLTTDVDSLLSYYFNYTSASNFNNQQLKFFIDEGTHWLYIKYRRTTSSTSGNYAYNSLNFTTSYEAIRVNQDIMGWYNNIQTISNTIGLSSPTSISNDASSTITAIGSPYREQLSTAINLPVPDFDLNSSFSNLTTTDGDIIHYYAYYIPGKQYIIYQWLDNLGNKDIYQVENTSYIYGRTNGTIRNIPDYTPYIEDNVDTKQWYYYENNDLTTTRLINQNNEISANVLGDTCFYGYKTSSPRTITINSSDIALGSIAIKNNPNSFAENDIIQIYANPTNIGYFANGYYIENMNPNTRYTINGPIQNITISDSNITIYSTFRSTQVYAPQNYEYVYIKEEE